jgi:hypothetical protein
MAYMDMTFLGPIKVHVEELPGRHPKRMVKVGVSVTNEEVVFKTSIYAPPGDIVDEALIGAGLYVLRTLCVAFENPVKFREIMAIGDPEKEGIPVAVPEHQVEEWIAAGKAMENQLKEEACPLSDDYIAGRPVKGEYKPE